MQFLRDEKGSTLLMTVITIAVLTVLGTTVLSLSIMNYNMKYTDTMLKRTQYYTESGIDQVYSILGDYVDQALVIASSNTEDAVVDRKEVMNRILGDIRNLETNFSLQMFKYEEPEVERPITFEAYSDQKLYIQEYLMDLSSVEQEMLFTSFSDTVYYDGCFLKVMIGDTKDTMVQFTDLTRFKNGNTSHQYHSIIVDEESMTRYHNERMNYFFKVYLDDHITDIENAIVFDEQENEDEDHSYVFLDNEAVVLNHIKHASIEPFKDDISGDIVKEQNTFTIKELQSKFTYYDRTQKTIETDLVITAPTDMMPIKVNQSKYVTLDNPLWQYALVTEKNLFFENVESDITGSVYALGTKANDFREITEYDGMKILGSRNVIEINGDMVTQSFVQMGQDTTNSTLMVNNGHIYSDSLAIQKDTSGNVIQVNNGNVYTKNDLVLNGENNKILIDGNYYGFISRANDYYLLSSIVINADIASGESSLLRINGETPSHPKQIKENFPVDLNEKENGIYIGGTSFINDEFDPNPNRSGIGSTLYESGESMGIQGNYLAYAIPIEDWNMGEPATGKKSNLQLYYLKDGNHMTVSEKADYFKESFESGVLDPYLETEAWNIDIAHEDYLFTQGAVVGHDNNEILENITYSYEIHDTANNSLRMQNYAEVEILKDHIFLLNYLRHRRSLESIPSNFFGWTEGDEIFLEDLISDMQKATAIVNYSRVATSTETLQAEDVRTVDVVKGGITNQLREVAIVQGNLGIDTKNILLVGEDGLSGVNTGDITTVDGENYYVIKTTDDEPSEMQGVILTNKKVRISGNIDFYGSIIAREDIYLGDGTINIINNELNVRNYLTRLVMESPKLSTAFDPDTSSETHPLKSFPLQTVESTEEIIVAPGDVNEMRKNYDAYIDIRNWRIVDES